MNIVSISSYAFDATNMKHQKANTCSRTSQTLLHAEASKHMQTREQTRAAARNRTGAGGSSSCTLYHATMSACSRDNRDVMLNAC